MECVIAFFKQLNLSKERYYITNNLVVNLQYYDYFIIYGHLKYTVIVPYNIGNSCKCFILVYMKI